MTNYQRYLKAMNKNKIRPLQESLLLKLWDNWHCTDEDEKKSFHHYELGQHWRERQLEVMRELGIDEPIKFKRGGNSKLQHIYFNDKTKDLFAVSQFAIMRKLDFTENNRVHAA